MTNTSRPHTDTGDFLFSEQEKKSRTFGLAATRQLSRPVHDLEMCSAEYSKALRGDASVGTSLSFRQEVETWPTTKGARRIWMVGRGSCAFFFYSLCVSENGFQILMLAKDTTSFFNFI